MLSAFRGPDKEAAQGEIKQASTAVIRASALPITFCQLRPYYAVFLDDKQEYVEKRQASEVFEQKTGWHFKYHAQAAFRALKLAWTGLNPTVKNPLEEVNEPETGFLKATPPTNSARRRRLVHEQRQRVF